MPSIFSSPLLYSQPKEEQTEYALSYHLDKTIPRGSVIYALFPKKILGKLLPKIVKEKKCTLITLYGNQAPLKQLSADSHGKELPEPDIILSEPDGFTFGGALFKPEETELVSELPLLCIGSGKQWTPITPSTHDLVPVKKIISEHGIHTPEQMEEIIASSSPNP
jgi:hypothetical protein